jgi:hypothetical protein
MRYLYRCPECGREAERNFPITEPVPERVAAGDQDPECTWFRRVYEPPATALGPEYAKYSDNNGYIDRDKYYGQNWAREHNSL